jgi:hypothetical protein
MAWEDIFTSHMSFYKIVKVIEDKYYYMDDYQPTGRGIERHLGDGDKQGRSQMQVIEI